MMNQAEWLVYGLENGFCGPRVCIFHDGLPTTKSEDDEMDEGNDPCVFLIRMYSDAQERAEIEANHSPSVWRR